MIAPFHKTAGMFSVGFYNKYKRTIIIVLYVIVVVVVI
jgi:hypothetical protein